MVTVIDVLRELGIEPEKRLSWKIGSAVATRYLEVYGHLPRKELRAKTKGEGGSHCFARYPDDFRLEIVGIVDIYFDRRYSFVGRASSLSELADIRGCSISAMLERLRRFSVSFAVRGP